MLAINHIGVSVPDIEAAVRWYTKVMGFHLLGGKIKHFKRSETGDNGIFKIYPASLQEVKLGFMATGNGVGFEVFEFVEPGHQQPRDFHYNLGGFFHLCVTDANPDALLAKVISEGGSAVGEPITNSTSKSRCIYCKDPWGNVLELMNMSFDQMGTLDSADGIDIKLDV
ncbi:hypothetical protein CPLU01_12041 [Colletotrichum plurivorum]|uniref:VOC domain-containing protein n=1 Tax=Colletotrichum plurivorum TaxID=2175906 RepID=A0A8H6K0B9_9PEZI|nr:hypothetical protein CPLU01_12041 [Colletotrichum plurivorum]